MKNPPQSPPTSAQFLKFWFLQGAPTPERGDWVISHVLRAISAPYDFYIQRNEPSNMAACNVVEKRDWKKLSPKMHFPLESLLLIESSWIYAQWYRAIIAAKYQISEMEILATFKNNYKIFELWSKISRQKTGTRSSFCCHFGKKPENLGFSRSKISISYGPWEVDIGGRNLLFGPKHLCQISMS